MILNTCMFMFMTQVFGKSTYYDPMVAIVSSKDQE